MGSAGRLFSSYGVAMEISCVVGNITWSAGLRKNPFVKQQLKKQNEGLFAKEAGVV